MTHYVIEKLNETHCYYEKYADYNYLKLIFLKIVDMYLILQFIQREKIF